MADPKANEVIDAHLASRISDLTDLQAQYNQAIDAEEWQDADDAQERIDNYALCLDLSITMKVQISTGGPGDEFEIKIAKTPHGWELAEDYATYRYLEWGDGAERRTDDPAVMAYLENYVECLSPEWNGAE